MWGGRLRVLHRAALRIQEVSSLQCGSFEKYSYDLGRDGGGEPRLEEVTVTSCSVPLASCHGAHVTTVEGLGSTRRGLHPVQVRPSLWGTRASYLRT